MAVLTRRRLQRLLSGSTTFLPDEQARRFVQRLNNPVEALDAEWELIILAALAHMGQVEHEPLSGKSRLDLRFTSAQWPSFIGDIRTVSDRGYERENPLEHFSEMLSNWARQLRSEGVVGSFSYRIEADRAAPWAKKHKTRLLVPQLHELKEYVFNEDFLAYIARIRLNPEITHHHTVHNQRACLSIAFQPKGYGISAIYAPYNTAHTVEHNVVYRALEKKTRQIKRAGARVENEYRGIVLCDGGCGIFRGLAGVGEISIDNIVHSFLRRTDSIDFVCCVDVHPAFSTLFSSDFILEFKPRIWTRAHIDISRSLAMLFESALRSIPIPKRTGRNAALNIEWAQQHPEFYGSEYKRDCWMQHDKITLSSRAVMDFLAGRLTRDEFESIARMPIDQLKRELDRGATVTNISISRLQEEDDDVIAICLGGPDPAVSDFRLPGDPVEKTP